MFCGLRLIMPITMIYGLIIQTEILTIINHFVNENRYGNMSKVFGEKNFFVRLPQNNISEVQDVTKILTLPLQQLG